MLYAPHFLFGAAIVKSVPNPYIGLPLAFLSHFLLDMTPHNDFDLKPGITLKEFLKPNFKYRNIILAALIVDYILTFVALIWVWISFKNFYLIVGGVAGVFPDAFEQTLMIFGLKLPGWQDKIQWRVSARYGFISYPIVSMVALYLLL